MNKAVTKYPLQAVAKTIAREERPSTAVRALAAPLRCSARRTMAASDPGSSVSIRLIRAGDTTSYPQTSQSVAIHYDAYLPNGTMWDSSRKRGRPLRFRLGVNQVIKGLDETVMQMSMGMRARVTIPSTLAYGERGFPGLVPPNTAIDFDLELLEIV